MQLVQGNNQMHSNNRMQPDFDELALASAADAKRSTVLDLRAEGARGRNRPEAVALANCRC